MSWAGILSVEDARFYMWYGVREACILPANLLCRIAI